MRELSELQEYMQEHDRELQRSEQAKNADNKVKKQDWTEEDMEQKTKQSKNKKLRRKKSSGYTKRPKPTQNPEMYDITEKRFTVA